MYRRLGLLFVLISALSLNQSFAQMVGGNVFMQGRWLEIGELNNGAFGTCSSPLTYHAHNGGATFTPGVSLGEVYDWGHDGWSVGTPPLMGDYTQPGYPFEGWSIEINLIKNDAWQGCPGTFAGTGTLTGSVTGYTNTGGRAIGIWDGTAGPLSALAIRQETRVDTNASWVVVTVTMQNTGAAPLPGVYYMRCNDPDNVSTWGGGSCTINTIQAQNDADHRVFISTTACTGTMTGDTSYMGLGTKDCRAKGVICGSTGLTPGGTLISTIYADIPGSTSFPSAQGYTNSADQGIALVYKIGTILPGDRAIISYAYFFDGNTGIDSAFPEPQLVVNGTPIAPTGPAPAPTIDTFFVCANPGVATLTVDILNADDKCWSWSTWNWAPATGLASTTGLSKTINLALLPGVTTYTITGTNNGANMFSCAERTFYLTVVKCLKAESNSPGPPGATICEGDTLNLFAIGDSTGASYYWYGPGGFTTTAQNPNRMIVSFADTGVYYVVKTTGVSHDTAHTRVVINPLPFVSATSNSPICSGFTLSVTATPISPGETFTWSGPNGFTSALPADTRTLSPVSHSGLYKVVTTLNGCTDSNFVAVVVDSTPAIPVVWNNGPLCSEDTLKLFATDGTPGVSYNWDGPYGWTSIIQNPVIPLVDTNMNHTFTVTATLGVCTSSATMVPAIIKTPAIPGVGSNAPICLGDTLKLISADATLGVFFTWTGPAGFSTVVQNPIITPAAFINSGVYKVTASNGMCSRFDTTRVIVKPVPMAVAGNNSAVCAGDTLKLFSSSVTGATYFNWLGPDYFVSNQQNPRLLDSRVAATGVYTVTITLDGCSDTAHTTVLVNTTPGIPDVYDTAFCQHEVSGRLAALGAGIKWYATPTGGTPITWPTPSTTDVGKTTWYVSQTLGKCTGPRASVTATIHPQPLPSLLVSDSVICGGKAVTFHLVNNGDDLSGLVWDFGDSDSVRDVNPMFHSFEAARVFTVAVTAYHKVCATTTQDQVIKVGKMPAIDLGPDTSICEGSEAIYLNDRINTGNPNARWKWSNGETGHKIAVTQPGSYYTMVTIDGCTAIDSVIVRRNCYIDVPNVFTPNGDGLNDYFFPRQYLSMGLTTFKMDIYNRWGQLVFNTASIEGQGWDGKLNGTLQPEGVYVYRIDATFKDGKIEHHQGNVTLLK